MLVEKEKELFERFCTEEGIEPHSHERAVALAAWKASAAALDERAREIPLFEMKEGDNLLITLPWILNRDQRKRLSEMLNAALAEQRPFFVLEGNPSAAILRGGLSIPCIVADDTEIKNANPLGPLTVEMINAGELALSEWLNDNAPIGQERYRQPAIEVFKAMTGAAPQSD